MKKIYLIDANNFIYRMFFALPEFSISNGKIVNAIFGMAKFFVGQLLDEKPDYLFFIKDAPGDNFRHKLYSDYKATRDRMPDNLRSQIQDIEHMVELMGIKLISIPGFEADDVIASLATSLSKNKDFEIDILTGDKDLYSFVSSNVKIYDTMKKKKFGPEETKQKFGIESKYIIDYLSIVGDTADNIPGIEGFGPKKAIDLINNIGGIEEIYKIVEKVQNNVINIDDLDKNISTYFKGKTFDKLVASKDKAFLSKSLATINLEVEIKDFDLNDYIFDYNNLVNEKVVEFFKNFEFKSLIKEENESYTKWEDLKLSVKIIGDSLGLLDLLSKIEKYSEIIIDTETTSLDIIEAKLVGISIYLDDDYIYYINRLHNGPKVDDTDLKEFLNKMMYSNKTLIGHNIKYDLEILELFLEDSSKNNIINSKNNMQMSLGIE